MKTMTPDKVALKLVSLSESLVTSTDPTIAAEGRALLRSAAVLLGKVGEQAHADKITRTVEGLSRIAKDSRIRHRVGVKS